MKKALFHDDGCVVANIPVQIYRVTWMPKCPHTKVLGGQLFIRAPSESAAASYARQWLKIPQNMVTSATLIDRAQSEPASRNSGQAQPTPAGRPGCR